MLVFDLERLKIIRWRLTLLVVWSWWDRAATMDWKPVNLCNLAVVKSAQMLTWCWLFFLVFEAVLKWDGNKFLVSYPVFFPVLLVSQMKSFFSKMATSSSSVSNLDLFMTGSTIFYLQFQSTLQIRGWWLNSPKNCSHLWGEIEQLFNRIWYEVEMNTAPQWSCMRNFSWQNEFTRGGFSPRRWVV